MTVRFNNNTNTPSSDITLNSQGSPRASQRRAALFSVGKGGKELKKMKLFVHCHPKISSRAGNQARVSQVPVRCCNYHILSQSDLSNPLGSLETS